MVIVEKWTRHLRKTKLKPAIFAANAANVNVLTTQFIIKTIAKPSLIYSFVDGI